MPAVSARYFTVIPTPRGMNVKTETSKSVRSIALLSALASLTAGVAHAQSTTPFEKTVWASAGWWQRYTVEIPAGTASLEVVISGGTGDADLYVRQGEQPTESAYDCRPFKDSVTEVCTFTNPAMGIWHIGLRGYTDFGEVDLKAVWSGAVATPVPAPAPLDWTKQVLDQHNLYRAQHCAPELAWDETIAATAQEYANRCIWDHDSTTLFGENMAYRDVTDSALTTVDRWYAENSDYDFAAPGSSQNTGHFTQVVWNGTTRIGCARAECPYTALGSTNPGNAYLYVCRYAAPGNTTGAFPENVKPKSDSGLCE